MKKQQEQLLELIVSAIHGAKLEDIQDKDWEGILEEAREHQVKGMIYPAVDREQIEGEIGESLFANWKRETFRTGVSQIQHIYQVGRILNLFNIADIKVIVLKGLVIREYYPRPELRTMCDADLLVHEKDLKAIETIILQEGYAVNEVSALHIRYTHPRNAPIEIHWTIRDEGMFEDKDVLEQALWLETVSVQVAGIETLTLGLEDTIVHLCIHMVTHLALWGFGIRQVLDLVVLMNAKGEDVNWRLLCKKVKDWELETFVVTIFKVAESLFGLPFPHQLNKLGKVKDNVVTELIEDIWAAGVHGKRDTMRLLMCGLAEDVEDKKAGVESNVRHNFVTFLFPSADKLPDVYHYAKKNKWLLPVAWVHRTWNGIWHKEYKLGDKLKFAFTAFRVSQKRNKLLRNLNL